MSEGLVQILEGNTFVVSDDRGDIESSSPERMGNLEVLDLPGRWRRMDAFGRGRIDTDRVTLR
ncbi:MAG TPA: hypothetical protein VKU39_11730 [Streptosporangiaceae bacterium]|nr:hypothetical protein [Streptosporangiaceae bacterium]